MRRFILIAVALAGWAVAAIVIRRLVLIWREEAKAADHRQLLEQQIDAARRQILNERNLHRAEQIVYQAEATSAIVKAQAAIATGAKERAKCALVTHDPIRLRAAVTDARAAAASAATAFADNRASQALFRGYVAPIAKIGEPEVATLGDRLQLAIDLTVARKADADKALAAIETLAAPASAPR